GGSPGTRVNKFGLGCAEGIGAACAGRPTGAALTVCSGSPTGAALAVCPGAPTGALPGAREGAGTEAAGAVTRNPLVIASVAGASATACVRSVVTDSETRYLSCPDVAMTLR